MGENGRLIADTAHGIGDFALDHGDAALDGRIGDRHGRKQAAGIIMRWRFEHLPAAAHFHDLAEIKHGDAVAHLFHDSHVMADEQESEVEALLQVEQQVADLRLDGDIER